MEKLAIRLILASLSLSLWAHAADLPKFDSKSIQPSPEVKSAIEEYWKKIPARKFAQIPHDPDYAEQLEVDRKLFEKKVGKKRYRLAFGLEKTYESEASKYFKVNVSILDSAGKPLMQSDGCYHLRQAGKKLVFSGFDSHCME